jgi:pilus assembly protein FimV
VGTKLELAKAYLEIGDKDGAREILQEVVKEGSGAQRDEAQKLISSL